MVILKDVFGCDLHLRRRVVALTLFTDYLYCVERYLASHNLLIIGEIGMWVKSVKGIILFYGYLRQHADH